MPRPPPPGGVPPPGELSRLPRLAAPTGSARTADPATGAARVGAAGRAAGAHRGRASGAPLGARAGAPTRPARPGARVRPAEAGAGVLAGGEPGAVRVRLVGVATGAREHRQAAREGRVCHRTRPPADSSALADGTRLGTDQVGGGDLDRRENGRRRPREGAGVGKKVRAGGEGKPVARRGEDANPRPYVATADPRQALRANGESGLAPRGGVVEDAPRVGQGGPADRRAGQGSRPPLAADREGLVPTR